MGKNWTKKGEKCTKIGRKIGPRILQLQQASQAVHQCYIFKIIRWHWGTLRPISCLLHPWGQRKKELTAKIGSSKM
uniref:Uncharacterized protein n=1 Tax=Romanomermis culicivorax TaxID=13658 RepID=A0A915HXJ0_ROMCU